jgi:hypothetical protein
MVLGVIGALGLASGCWLVGLPILCGVIIGLLLGLFGAGEACIKHFALRAIACCNGCIPWNYARFLDWASDRIFWQKVGSGYIFIHRLLLEHFARMVE